MADYQKAQALYQWSTGEWVEGLFPSKEEKVSNKS